MDRRQETPQNFDNAAQTRDASADLAQCYRESYPRLVTIAAAVLGRQEGAEDVVQNAAQITIAKGRRFDGGAAMVRWLTGVVRHCALNQRRQTRNRKTFATDPNDMALVEAPATQIAATPDRPQTGELKAYQSDFDDYLTAALSELSDDARCCLLLRVIHGLSYEEIAELTGLPPGTAMSHVHRSKSRLRSQLRPDRPTPTPQESVTQP
jgi:RNA polymerase sigma-70 factor (ECF subfamily)